MPQRARVPNIGAVEHVRRPVNEVPARELLDELDLDAGARGLRYVRNLRAEVLEAFREARHGKT